jgi:thiamine-monophosphate kinase
VKSISFSPSTLNSKPFNWMEREFLQWLREHVPFDPRFALRLNDDAALLSLPARGVVVVTTDLLTEGVDFHLAKDDPRRIGRKALAANLSDLAAMAARPLAAFISLALPRRPAAARTTLELAIALYEGLIPIAAEFDLAIAGGDTNTHDGPLVISATLLGEVTERGPLTRSGGRVGDWLLITGQLGGTILGHAFDFAPRVREALLLNERYMLHAGMDISDGLALDASRLAAASGCGALLKLAQIPIAPVAYVLSDQEKAADRNGAALAHALGDGEDFELLIAAAPDVAARMIHEQPLGCPITHVGELIAEEGLWQQTPEGSRIPLEPTGWLH